MADDEAPPPPPPPATPTPPIIEGESEVFYKSENPPATRPDPVEHKEGD